MDREYTTNKVPEKLVQKIEAAGGDSRFRRRAVLTKGNAKWELQCCTVELILPGESLPESLPTRTYKQAVLFEDFLNSAECLEFVRDLHSGSVRFGEISLHRAQEAQWSSELLPVCNEYMERAGYAIALQFAQGGGRAAVRTLLAADHPYYPDAEAATRDWIPLRIYHGYSDSRNDQVIFLLPEARAYLASAEFSPEGALEVTVSGSEVDELALLVKGAYWEGKKIFHFGAPVVGSKAELQVPRDADTFEYFLIDREAIVYDFHREDRFTRLDQGRRTLGAVEPSLVDQIRKAARDGEGLQTEFKPFIDPGQKLRANNYKTKLLETVTTVVAFANTRGGHIYLGIEDDCTISGVDADLRAWAKGALDSSTVDRYLGALKSKIKDLVYGEVTLRLSHAELNNVTVLVIEVPEATQKPISLHQDRHLYIRAGANNQKALPELWKAILQAEGPLSRQERFAD